MPVSFFCRLRCGMNWQKFEAEENPYRDHATQILKLYTTTTEGVLISLGEIKF